jgi:translation initiation factor RLI1
MNREGVNTHGEVCQRNVKMSGFLPSKNVRFRKSGIRFFIADSPGAVGIGSQTKRLYQG